MALTWLVEAACSETAASTWRTAAAIWVALPATWLQAWATLTSSVLRLSVMAETDRISLQISSFVCPGPSAPSSGRNSLNSPRFRRLKASLTLPAAISVVRFTTKLSGRVMLRVTTTITPAASATQIRLISRATDRERLSSAIRPSRSVLNSLTAVEPRLTPASSAAAAISAIRSGAKAAPVSSARRLIDEERSEIRST